MVLTQTSRHYFRFTGALFWERASHPNAGRAPARGVRITRQESRGALHLHFFVVGGGAALSPYWGNTTGLHWDFKPPGLGGWKLRGGVAAAAVGGPGAAEAAVPGGGAPRLGTLGRRRRRGGLRGGEGEASNRAFAETTVLPGQVHSGSETICRKTSPTILLHTVRMLARFLRYVKHPLLGQLEGSFPLVRVMIKGNEQVGHEAPSQKAGGVFFCWA